MMGTKHAGREWRRLTCYGAGWDEEDGDRIVSPYSLLQPKQLLVPFANTIPHLQLFNFPQ